MADRFYIEPRSKKTVVLYDSNNDPTRPGVKKVTIGVDSVPPHVSGIYYFDKVWPAPSDHTRTMALEEALRRFDFKPISLEGSSDNSSP